MNNREKIKKNKKLRNKYINEKQKRKDIFIYTRAILLVVNIIVFFVVFYKLYSNFKENKKLLGGYVVYTLVIIAEIIIYNIFLQTKSSLYKIEKPTYEKLTYKKRRGSGSKPSTNVVILQKQVRLPIVTTVLNYLNKFKNMSNDTLLQQENVFQVLMFVQYLLTSNLLKDSQSITPSINIIHKQIDILKNIIQQNTNNIQQNDILNITILILQDITIAMQNQITPNTTAIVPVDIIEISPLVIYKLKAVVEILNEINKSQNTLILQQNMYMVLEIVLYIMDSKILKKINVQSLINIIQREIVVLNNIIKQNPNDISQNYILNTISLILNNTVEILQNTILPTMTVALIPVFAPTIPRNILIPFEKATDLLNEINTKQSTENNDNITQNILTTQQNTCAVLKSVFYILYNINIIKTNPILSSIEIIQRETDVLKNIITILQQNTINISYTIDDLNKIISLLQDTKNLLQVYIQPPTIS